MGKPYLGMALFLAGCSAAPPTPSPSPFASATVASPVPTADELKRDLTVFASDSFRGRETGTNDERRAAAFLVSRLTALGLTPGGDSGYYQRVPLVHPALSGATRFTVSTPARTTTLLPMIDLVPILDLGGGEPPPKATAEGPLVFAGYGVEDDFTKVPIKGHVVVVVNGAPPRTRPNERAALESESAITARLERLIPLHPSGIIVLLTGSSTDVGARIGRELSRALTLGGPSLDVLPDGERPVPMILIGRPSAGSPLLPAGWTGDGTPRVLRGKRFTGHIELRQEPVMSYNVVAIVPGTDAALRRTYVAFGAHYDHLGIVPTDHGDSIADGADDDGSGSVALLALARAFATSRGAPRRSILFVWHVGEEKGLLGSSYFTEHPTVPIDSIVAQINADMIGRNNPESLYVVGPMAAPHGQSRVLGAVVDSVNRALAHPFTFNREWDSPTHPEQIYYRSDHYNYARMGVPIVFFTSGMHADYHRVTDTPAKIDYDKLAHVDVLMFDLGTALANRATRPVEQQSLVTAKDRTK
ncbi:MAG TPA: M28 family peptidase [Gemmatimonadaceae bacterium]|nr:M28 family peptidase [Gemmatimonadaceae bacterium]